MVFAVTITVYEVENLTIQTDQINSTIEQAPLSFKEIRTFASIQQFQRWHLSRS